MLKPTASGTVFYPAGKKSAMRTILPLLTILMIATSIACNNENNYDKGEEVTTASAPPAGSVDSVATNRAAAGGNLKAIMDSNMVRMSRMELTNNPTKDFALLMRVHHAGARQLIDEALKQNQDSSLAKIARKLDGDLRSEVVMLNRFIIDKRFNKQQKESPVSNNLMKAMTPNNEPSMPLSGNVAQDFAMLMITSLQSANDLVEVMQDAGVEYDISGFAEVMVPRNEKYIQQLKEWTTKNS
jgi:uncharacterized protein (DUF305 family)